jgi:hypothetical protein
MTFDLVHLAPLEEYDYGTAASDCTPDDSTYVRCRSFCLWVAC